MWLFCITCGDGRRDTEDAEVRLRRVPGLTSKIILCSPKQKVEPKGLVLLADEDLQHKDVRKTTTLEGPPPPAKPHLCSTTGFSIGWPSSSWNWSHWQRRRGGVRGVNAAHPWPLNHHPWAWPLTVAVL